MEYSISFLSMFSTYKHFVNFKMLRNIYFSVKNKEKNVMLSFKSHVTC